MAKARCFIILTFMIGMATAQSSNSELKPNTYNNNKGIK